MIKKILKSYALWIVIVIVAFVGLVLLVNNVSTEQYIIGDVVEINSGAARVDNFDKKDGAYTADSEKLFIRFEPDSCEFFDENGKPCEATDIDVGSRVKMTTRSGLKTDKYGYTTVYIDKVEVLMNARDNAIYQSQQAENEN